MSTRDNSGLRANLDQLHRAAADFIGVDSPAVILGRLFERAIASTAAGAQLLTVRTPDGRWLTHATGFEQGRAQELADQLRNGSEPSGAVVIDVGSARRRHGVWA